MDTNPPGVTTPGATGGGPPLDPTAAISAGWQALLARPWISLGVLLVVAAIQFACSFIPFVNILAGVLVMPALYAGAAWFFLRGVRRENPPFETAFEGFQRWPSTTGAVLLVSLGAMVIMLPVILTTIGMAGLGALLSGSRHAADFTGAMAATGVFFSMLFCVPIAAWWAARTGMTVFAVMEPERLPALEAVKRSFALTRGSFWRIVGLYLLCLLVTLVGFLALCVGVIPATVVTYYAYAHGYEQLRARAGLGAPPAA